MIVNLTGRLSAKEPGHCVIDVGGIGYGVNVSLNSLSQLPEEGCEVSLAVHTYVREDQFVLFGFTTPKERSIFRRLIGISGVGPKIALAMLSGLSPDDIVEAVGNRNTARLTTIPGIGKKTAERMVLELGDLFARQMSEQGTKGTSGASGIRSDAVSALLNLGYIRATAENALKKVEVSDSMRIEEVIKAALRELCRS